LRGFRTLLRRAVSYASVSVRSRGCPPGLLAVFIRLVLKSRIQPLEKVHCEVLLRVSRNSSSQEIDLPVSEATLEHADGPLWQLPEGLVSSHERSAIHSLHLHAATTTIGNVRVANDVPEFHRVWGASVLA
jgi:hypothetical protein